MTTTNFTPNQNLNNWVVLLHGLYGSTQNYSKSTYEIHTHLTEVCGVFGKHLLKKNDTEAAISFLPKMFAWGVALLKAVHPEETDLEGIILRKFPNLCPYCGKSPCNCWNGEKPTLDPERLRSDFYRNAPSMRRSANDFQMMFGNIYGESWGDINSKEGRSKLFTRMFEELAEIAEAIRFYHLYPENFENELADFFAWWFGLVSCFSDESGRGKLLVEDILWAAYPGHCQFCNLNSCFCRPGPVRELMSKPAPGQDHKFDVLTSLYNQTAYNEDIERLALGETSTALPASCVRIDIDNFKFVNDKYGHSAGDATLKHVAAILRSKARERDKVYRVGGDEFGILLMDSTAEEAAGMMKRVCRDLKEKNVRWVNASGRVFQFFVSASIGVAQCDDGKNIRKSFDCADQASYISKKDGKARVTILNTCDQ